MYASRLPAFIVGAILLLVFASTSEAVTCYACNGQCAPYSATDSNITTATGCASCKYVVAYGGFGDLSDVDDVGTPLCSSTACANGDEDAYSFQYLMNSYVYTMPAYSTCCNSDLCNVSSGAKDIQPVLWTLLVSLSALVAGCRAI